MTTLISHNGYSENWNPQNYYLHKLFGLKICSAQLDKLRVL